MNFREFQGVNIRTQPGQKYGPVGGPVGLIQNPVDVSFCRNNGVIEIDASFYMQHKNILGGQDDEEHAVD